jgi:exopolyphosphatase/guanosine-5'-triphosphate,3'-diphosphate pyrophosphatase
MVAAAFDIGTNTFLMVIGKKHTNGTWEILHDAHSIARLGEGVDTTKQISKEAYSRAAAIAQEYKELCASYKVETGIGVATSAVRDATNGQEICTQLSYILNFPIRPIFGDEEARFSFTGTLESLNISTVIDIGGGSTEYISGDRKSIKQRKSLQIGAVRLHERFFKHLPPDVSSIQAARREIREQLQTLKYHNIQEEIGEIIGVGGTFTTLAAIDLALKEFQSERVHNHSMNIETISRITSALLNSPFEALLSNPAIHPKRADILPAGALILEESLYYLGASTCKASTKGLRYGVLYSIE